MLELTVKGNSIQELKEQLQWLFITDAPVVEPVREPVITQAQIEENIANAPVHEEPPQPSLEEVRAALKVLRDKKGSRVVKDLLKAYGADSLPDLKPEDYLGALSRAQMEVE